MKGNIFPVDLELNIRGIFHTTPYDLSVYFNSKYVEEGMPALNGRAGMFGILVDSPQNATKVASAVDDMFHNSPQPTRTETEKAFGLEFVAMLGNVKAFILSICSAVLFATLLVSANTMAMSTRERTREVSVLKTLRYTRPTLLGLFVGEAVTLPGGRNSRCARGLRAAGRVCTLAQTNPVSHSCADLPRSHTRSHSRCRGRRIPERGCASLPRVQHGYCGGTPLHRLRNG